MVATSTPESKIALRFLSSFGAKLARRVLPKAVTLAFSKSNLKTIVDKYLPAVEQARKIYNYIEERKGRGNFITEVSMDETDQPQTPEELCVILFALAKKSVPVQVIAPKFSGEFYKGIDYVGNENNFQQEIKDDIQTIDFMTDQFDLPANLKLSMHSGSDKYSIYPKIKEVLQETNSGFHLKTAGTTWLEEINGLILSGKEGLQFARNLYKEARDRLNELSQPYKEVINIEKEKYYFYYISNITYNNKSIHIKNGDELLIKQKEDIEDGDLMLVFFKSKSKPDLKILLFHKVNYHNEQYLISQNQIFERKNILLTEVVSDSSTLPYFSGATKYALILPFSSSIEKGDLFSILR